MSGIRAIVVIAVPAVTALFGLLWLFSRKKPPSPRKPPDKHGGEKQTSVYSEQNNIPLQNSKLQKKNDVQTPVTPTPVEKSDADKMHVQSSVICQEKAVNCSGDGVNLHPYKNCQKELLTNKPASFNKQPQLLENSTSNSEPIAVDELISASEVKVSEVVNKPVKTTVTDSERLAKNAERNQQSSLSEADVEDNSQETNQVEEIIMLCNAGTVNSSPPKAQSFTSVLSQSLSNSLNSDSVVNSADIRQARSVSESSARSCESKADLDKSGENEALETPLSPMTRSWHEEVSDQESESNDLHRNSVGAQDNAVSSNLNVQISPVNSVSEQHISNGPESCPPTNHQVTENGAEKQGNGVEASGAKSKKKTEQQCNQTDNSANCDNLSEVSIFIRQFKVIYE